MFPKIIAAVIAVIIVTVSVLGFIVYYSSNISVKQNNTSGVPVEFNVTPVFDTGSTVYTSYSLNSSLNQGNFIGAHVEAWPVIPPGIYGSGFKFISTTSNDPVLNVTVNSTGAGNSYMKNPFRSYVYDWREFLNLSNQRGSETSLEFMVEYVFSYNLSYYRMYNYLGFIPLDVFSLNLSSSFDLSLHPSLAGLQMQLIPVGFFTPDRLPGGGGGAQYFWELQHQNYSQNARIPMFFGNDSTSSEEITDSVTLGIANAYTNFSAFKGSDISSTVSYSLGTTGSWNSYNKVGGSGITLYPTSDIPTESFGYIYAVGNFTMSKYRQWEVPSNGGAAFPDGNYYTTLSINSINVHKGNFVINSAFEYGNGSSLYSNGTAINTLGLFKYSADYGMGSMDFNTQKSWSEVIDSLGTSYSNLYGSINGLLSLGMAYMGALILAGTAGGWIPGDGWAQTAADIIAFTGFTSAVISFFTSGVVHSGSTTIVYFAYTKNSGFYNKANGNPVNVEVQQVTTPVKADSGNYELPILWLNETGG